MIPPCGRKPKNYSPLWRTKKDWLDAKAAKADRKRREAPFRRHMKQCELEERRRAEQEQALSELRSIDQENRLRSDPSVPLPGESSEEHAMRYACIMERRRREKAQPLWAQIENKARASGFYDA